MTGCSGCFNYTTTQARVNNIAVDPTTTTNGSIVAYAPTVVGGVNWTGPYLTNSFNTMRQDITALELSNMGSGVRACSPRSACAERHQDGGAT